MDYSKIDVLLVGAGLSNATIAAILHKHLPNKIIGVLEKSDNVGGLCYDEHYPVGKENILIHTFGPHIFHTKDKKIWDFVNDIVYFNPYEYYVTAKVGGRNIPLPFNLRTIETLFGTSLSNKIIPIIIKHFGFGNIIKLTDLTTAKTLPETTKTECTILNVVYNNLYTSLVEGYNKKQWGEAYNSYGLQTAERLPFRINYDCRYFDDKYCGIPSTSYCDLIDHMFKNSAKRHNIECYCDPNIIGLADKKIFTIGGNFKGIVVYSGRVDRLLESSSYITKQDALPGITTKFTFNLKNVEHFQDTAQVNYPNDFDYTRIIEHKKITGGVLPQTVISTEFPMATPSMEYPLMYPIRTKENIAKYNNMLDISSQFKNLYLCGRQATYDYLNMDIAIKCAMETAEKILERIG
jgi:UDP-galactopyranose mutase